jgi:hypothetical protein
MTNVVPFPRKPKPAEPGPVVHDFALLDRTPDVRNHQPLAGLSFDEWAQANSDRIWRALVLADRRDITFDDFARALWARCG